MLRASWLLASKFGGVVSWHSPDNVRCQIPAGVAHHPTWMIGRKGNNKTKKKNKKKGKAVAFDLCRRDDLFIWLGNYAHVRGMLGSSFNYLKPYNNIINVFVRVNLLFMM